MQDLFREFQPNTLSEWKAQLIKDLKGESYESLIWQNENGFDINPFYTSEDLRVAYEPAFTHADWEICVSAKKGDAKTINAELLNQLNSGATAISVDLAELDPEVVLNGIQLNFIQATFFAGIKAAQALKSYLEKNYDLADIRCSVFPEALTNVKELEVWQKEVAALFRDYSGIKTSCVNTVPYHNLNCLAYYEVALVISQLTEYLEHNENKASAFVVKAGVSADYFIQMAKLRAIRRLWNVLKEEYGVSNDLHLIVETGLTNKSISDSYNNLLRTTVEAMAAVSGGCNELIVTEFDVLFPSNNILAQRMAVNQQLILKEESYLDKMADSGCGSFYIESLTDAIAKKALETFQRFEKEGGYFKCLEKNIFSGEIASQAAQKRELLNAQKQIAIGVNKFKNEKEKIDLTAEALAKLKSSPFNNPVLNFELEHYFTLNNA